MRQEPGGALQLVERPARRRCCCGRASSDSAAIMHRSSRSRSRKARTTRDLPMPGAPDRSTTWPSPSLACRQRSRSRASSCSRPTSGVRASACRRLEPPLGAARAQDTWNARTGWAKPRRAQGRDPRPRTICRAAAACRRRRPPVPGSRQGLQPGGEVRASRRPPPPPAPRPRRRGHRPRPARGDPDPRRQWRARGCRQPADRRGDRQPGADRPLGLVLVGLRPAEVGEHAVAHELGDVARRNAPSRRPPRSGRRGLPRASPPGRAARDSAVEPTRSTNITVSCRRSACSRGGAEDWVSGRAGEEGAARGPRSAAMARSRRLRSPSDRPSATRSASVKSGRTSSPRSLARNSSAWRSRLSPRSQASMSTPFLPLHARSLRSGNTSLKRPRVLP